MDLERTFFKGGKDEVMIVRALIDCCNAPNKGKRSMNKLSNVGLVGYMTATNGPPLVCPAVVYK